MTDKITYTTTFPPDRWAEFALMKKQAVAENPAGFSEDSARLESLSEEDWRKQLEQNDDVILIVAECEKNIIGFGKVRFFSQDRMKHNAVLDDLYVDSNWRGQGVGSKIIELRTEAIKLRPHVSQVF